MKKLIALIIAAVMVFSAFSAVCADDELILDWAEFEEQINSTEENKETWAGEFITFDEIALQMYLPNFFEETELSEEDMEEGYIGYYVMGEDAVVAVQYVDVDGLSLEDYYAYLTDELGLEAKMAVINEFPAVVYTFTDDDGAETTVASFATEMGYIIEFAFYPTNDEGPATLALILMSSIQEA